MPNVPSLLGTFLTHILSIFTFTGARTVITQHFSWVIWLAIGSLGLRAVVMYFRDFL